MKHLFFLLFVTSLGIQGFIMAESINNKPEHNLQVQVQQLPRSTNDAPPQTQANQSQKNSYHMNLNDEDDNDNNNNNDEDDDDDDEDNYNERDVKDNRNPNAYYHSQNQSTSNSFNKGQSVQPTESVERTLSILKPDAVQNRYIGDVLSRFEDAGLRIVGIKMTKLDNEKATQFYKIHQNRPFFNDLVKFMSSNPVVVVVLEGKNAINKNRQLMGATDPSKADKGTIRADLAESTTRNVVHGSDSPESARQEILFFFQPSELYPN